MKISNRKNIVLFVNDSYFSYLLSKSIIESNYKEISVIFFSKSTVFSFKKIFNIFKKVPLNYFLYRSFIYIITLFFFNKKSVNFLADKYNISKKYVFKGSELKNIVENNEVAFLFNFDIIIKNNILSKFNKGVFNIHASKLPKDKGISPVLWAFVRGDQEVWSSIYKVNEGIDSGPLVKQIKFLIKKNDTAFSLYSRVCKQSGIELNDILHNILCDKIELIDQSEHVESNYLSWPDRKFLIYQKQSQRKLISFKSLLNII